MLRKVSEQSWKVCVGVLLQRWPSVAPPMTELEKQYAALQHTVEVERSLLSDHEIRHRNDTKKIAEMKEEAMKQRSGRSEEQALFITAREDEQRWHAELEELKRCFEKNAQVIAEAHKGEKDWQNEFARSTNRLLDRNLYLLVDQRFSTNSAASWTLPTLSWDESLDGFYLRRTANRLLASLATGSFRLGAGDVGNSAASFEYRLLSNAPCAFTKWRFAESVRTRLNAVGVKLFVYKAHLVGGNLNANALTERGAKSPSTPTTTKKAKASTTSVAKTATHEASEVHDFRWCSEEELIALYAKSRTTQHYASMLKPLLIR